MGAKLEKIENSEAYLDVEVDAETLEQGLEKAYRKVVQKVNLPGFRKGKAPRTFLEAHYGKEILYEDALEIVIPDAYEKALTDLEIEPIAHPEFDIGEIKPGEVLQFKVKVAVKPNVILGPLEGLEVNIPMQKISDADVDHRMEDLRSRYAKLVEKTDVPSEFGDTVTIDFAGSIDEVAFEGGTGEDYQLELGSSTFIPGFEEQLIGLRVGDSKEVKVVFPEAYHAEDLAGIYGEATCQALQKFQEMRGLQVNGIAGPNTWKELNLNQRSFIPLKKAKPISARPKINIHVDTRILNFTSNGIITTYPVAVGRPTTPTPIGSWTIVFKSVNPGGPFGARWMRLSVPWGGYGIHGTNNPDSIGKAVSHGCIRLYNEDVITLYDQVRIGTPVIITGQVRKIRNLRVGFRGEDVRDVQQLLFDLGYYPYTIDGLYGRMTRQAVIRFQKASGLTPDGIAGKITCKNLQIAHDLATNNTDP